MEKSPVVCGLILDAANTLYLTQKPLNETCSRTAEHSCRHDSKPTVSWSETKRCSQKFSSQSMEVAKFSVKASTGQGQCYKGLTNVKNELKSRDAKFYTTQYNVKVKVRHSLNLRLREAEASRPCLTHQHHTACYMHLNSSIFIHVCK